MNTHQVVNACYCGSGKPQRKLRDVNDIFVAYVCDACEREVRSRYRPEIFSDPNHGIPDEELWNDHAMNGWDYRDPFGVWRQVAASYGCREKEAPFDFVAHLERQRKFSEATFGPGKRVAGIIDHIKKELVEVQSDPGDPEEWLDIAVLAIDGALRCGASPKTVAELLIAKQERNENRSWPDWRTMSEDAAIEHDRTVPGRTAKRDFLR